MIKQKPPLGWCVEGKIVRVIDGDTIDFEVKKILRVRLLDVYAPELKTAEGKKIAQTVQNKYEGKNAILFVPGNMEIQDLFTFGRILGIVWVDDLNLNDEINKIIKKTNPE